MKQKLLILLLLLIACRNNESSKQTVISIGEYTFILPSGFKLIKEQGIDSYVGKIQGNDITLHFDFGYYSNQLIKTPEEFFNKEGWLKMVVAEPFLKEGETYDDKTLPNVTILDIQLISNNPNVDYLIKCMYKDSAFTVPITLPQLIKQHHFEIDTVNNYYSKIVYPKDQKNIGTTGIYIKNLSSFNKSINSYKSLSISTENLTEKNQNVVLKILKSVTDNKGNNLIVR